MAIRKQFQDFAYGTASRFVSRSNDIGGFWGVGVLSREVHRAGHTQRTFDLLGVPDPFDGGSAQWLQERLLTTGIPETWLASATLHVMYSPRPVDRVRPRWWSSRIARADVQTYRVVAIATLVDDRGRIREASADAWCWDQTQGSGRR
jgi:hypothetical protein